MSFEPNDRPTNETPNADEGAASPLGARLTPLSQPQKSEDSEQGANSAPFAETKKTFDFSQQSETEQTANSAQNAAFFGRNESPFQRPGDPRFANAAPNGPNGNPNFPRRYPSPADFGPPPRPMGFGLALLKDLLTTVAGVAVFCFLGFFLFLLGVATLVALFNGDGSTSSVVLEEVLSGEDDAAGKIVILPIEGLIETDESGFLSESIEIVRDDPQVRGLVLRINSPGGTVSGSDYYLHLLRELKEELGIPIVVSMGDIAASGGYYIATVGDKIFAERSTETGSIGVIIPMYDASALCEKIGVASSPVVSGPMKGMGDLMKKPTPEERAIFQSLVDETYEQFLEVVREGRPWFRGEDGDAAAVPRRTNAADLAIQAFVEDDATDKNAENVVSDETVESGETSESAVFAERDAELRKIADGRIYTARQAKELRLIDEIGFLSDAVEETIALAGLDADSTQVVRYSEIESWTDSLGLASMKARDKRVEKAAKALSAPKAYYLAPRSLPFGD